MAALLGINQKKILKLLKKDETLNTTEIASALGITSKAACAALDRLAKLGLVEKSRDGRVNRWRRTSADLDALWSEEVWRAMRVLKEFTVEDLMGVCPHVSSKRQVYQYCYLLSKAGYLKANSLPSGKRIYRFIPGAYTGPRPPVRRVIFEIYDPNIDAVTWRAMELSRVVEIKGGRS